MTLAQDLNWLRVSIVRLKAPRHRLVEEHLDIEAERQVVLEEARLSVLFVGVQICLLAQLLVLDAQVKITKRPPKEHIKHV